MKNVFKFIISFICYVLLIPLSLALTLCISWYALPAFQLTFVGEYLKVFLLGDKALYTTGIVLGCILLFFILSRLFKVVKSSKPNNFYTHLITWLIAIALAAESVYTFFTTASLETVNFELDLPRKIGIGVGSILMLLYSVIANRVRDVINRKIQAYDTAKELNAVGRSSVVGVHILKTIDFICPEIILLLVLCFALSFEIALYFIFILISMIIPIIGNIICDKRARAEAKQKEKEKMQAQANATAEAVAELLQQQQQKGNNL